MTRWKSLSGKLWVTAICSDMTKLHEIFRLSFYRESFLPRHRVTRRQCRIVPGSGGRCVTNDHSAERLVFYRNVWKQSSIRRGVGVSNARTLTIRVSRSQDAINSCSVYDFPLFSLKTVSRRYCRRRNCLCRLISPLLICLNAPEERKRYMATLSTLDMRLSTTNWQLWSFPILHHVHAFTSGTRGRSSPTIKFYKTDEFHFL